MKTAPSRLYSFGPFSLDTGDRTLLRNSQHVMLEPKVLSLLLVLVERNPSIVPKDELMEAIWPDTFVAENSLSVCLSKLRKVLRDAPGKTGFIRTVPRRGYRFVGCADETQTDRNGGATEASQTFCDRAAEHPTNGAGAKKAAIAVLPFRFLGSANDGFLGLGIADALITRLSNLDCITVRPTSSVRKYVAEDSVAVGQQLRVESLLEGSIQRIGRRIRVTAQLVNVTDGSLIWAGTFDEKFTNIFTLEDSISEGVATALAPRLTSRERTLLAKRGTENAEAHEAYLRGRYFFGKRSKEGFEKGIEWFERAIRLDAHYALAYSGLADCYGLLGTHGVRTRHCNLKAEQAAVKAIALDPELGEAYASLANQWFRQWDWSAAERAFVQSIRLNGNYAIVHNWYAMYLQLVGHGDESLRENALALDLDPMSVVFRCSRGKLLYFARRYEEALEQLSGALALDHHYYIALYYSALVYEAVGRYNEAIDAIEQALFILEKNPELTACLGRLYALAGRRTEATDVITELTRTSEAEYVQPYLFAVIYEALGEKERAFDWLERGYHERDEDLGLLKVDPRLDRLRSDRRFENLMEKVGLSSANNRLTLVVGRGQVAAFRTYAE